jgi:MFS family permease
MGRLADLHGRRRLLLVGMVVFALGSVGAALAPNILVLLVCRAVQGVGGAVYPLTLAIARDRSGERGPTAAISVLTAGFGVGTAIGFLAGGLLAEHASWRYVFVLGAVLVGFAALLVARVVEEGEQRARGRFDVVGTVLLGGAAVALLTALTLVVSLGWSSPVVAGLLTVAVVAAFAWVQAERRVTDPLVDVHVLTDRRVALANAATIGLGWLLFSSYLLVPELVRSPPAHGYGLGADSATVGYLLLPLAAGQTVAALAAGWSLQRVTARWVYAVGLLVLALGSALLALDRSSVALTVVATGLLGCGAGTALQAASAVATEGVAADVASISAAVNSTTRRLAGGIGGQVSTLLLASVAVSGHPTPAAFTTSFAVGGFLCLVGAALVGVGG